MWAVLIIIASFGAASEKVYLFPDVYEHGDGLNATVDERALAQLIEENSSEGEGDEGIPSVKERIDLNNDGKSEIFLLPSRIEWTKATWYNIFEERNGHYVCIGSTSIGFSLGKSKNGYARLLTQYNSGENAEPIWTASVKVFEGGRYELEYDSGLTSGQMEAKGIEAYRAKDYATAEIWFLNLIRSGLGDSMQAENNLALVLLRTKRYQEVIGRLEAAMAKFELGDREYGGNSVQLSERAKLKANAYYNLGKANEGLGNLAAAWKNYYEACKVGPSDERKATLKRLSKAGVDTTGYKVIW